MIFFVPRSKLIPSRRALIALTSPVVWGHQWRPVGQGHSEPEFSLLLAVKQGACVPVPPALKRKYR